MKEVGGLEPESRLLEWMGPLVLMSIDKTKREAAVSILHLLHFVESIHLSLFTWIALINQNITAEVRFSTNAFDAGSFNLRIIVVKLICLRFGKERLESRPVGFFEIL